MAHKPEWKRPKTIRAYLHPPLAKRLCLIWPDFKLINASLLDNKTHMSQPAIGVTLLQGEAMEPLELTDTVFEPVSAGIPVYTLVNRTNGCKVKLQAFCDMDRQPTLFFRVTLENDSAETKAGCLGVLARSGEDTYLSCQHQEGYGVYDPNIKTWYMLKRTWKQTGECEAVDGDGALRLQIPENLRIRFVKDAPGGSVFEANDYFRLDYILAAGEILSFEGALRAKSAPAAFDYEAEKAKTTAAWQEILSDIAVVPDTEEKICQDAYRHLAMQMMQMLARYEGADLITPRQGDLGRFVWPYEATIMLTTMDHIGLRRYTAAAYRYFVQKSMEKDGPNKGRVGGANSWDNFTGATVWGLSEHLKLAGTEEELDEFIPPLMDMLHYIEGRRSAEGKGYKGIYPAGQGSDWKDVAQFWTLTDSYNAMGERSLAEMLEMYHRPEAREARAAYEDYSKVIIGIRDELYKGHENDEAYILPHELGVPFEDSEQYSYYVDGAPMLLNTGFMDPHSRMFEQMEAFFRTRGQFERGMTGRMTNCNLGWDSAYFGGYGDVWYTQQSEYYWIKAWAERGEYDKAKESLDALMTWGMTPEYIVSERYCSIQPWYAPWQPNASGSARMMQSMLNYFGEKTTK